MFEVQAPYTDNYAVEDIYPHSIELPEIVTRMSREITRNATLLIRIINLLQKGAPLTDEEYIIKRITKKLLNQFILWENHYRVEKEEYTLTNSELEKAELERETLHIKRKLNDITEEAYSLKLSVSDWDVKDLSVKKTDLEKNLKAYKNLRGLQVFIDVNDLYEISKNQYQILDELSLEQGTVRLLKLTLTKILESVTSKNPSTL